MKNRAHPSVISRTPELRDSLSLSVLERAGNSWLRACEVDQHADTTLSFRRLLLAKLLWYLRRENLSDCGVDELRDFLGHITNGHKEPEGRFGNPKLKEKPKPSTVATYHRDLRAMFNWITSEGKLDACPMDRIPTPIVRADQIQPFSPENLESLLKAAKEGRYPRRDVALLLFMLDTGLRASEVASLTVGDVDLTGRELRVLGKGRKERSVHVSKTTAKAMFNLLKDRPELSDPLFPAEGGEAMTRSGIRQLYVRLGKTAGLTGTRCSPHTMRHTFAVEFLRGGGNEFALMTLLGHTDLKMTQKYVAFAKADIRNQHRMASPVDRLRTTKGRRQA